MKIIHLKCGHKLKVRSWPSKAGLAKVRHHYKKFHPARMKKMTRKSLATKRRKGIINPRTLTNWARKVALAKAYIEQYGDTQEARHAAAMNNEQISSAQWKEATKRKRGSINPSMSKYFSYLNDISQDVSDIGEKGFLDTALASHLGRHFKISSDKARKIVTAWRKRKLSNPKRKRIRYKMADYGYERPLMAAEKRRAKKSTVIYDKLLTIEAHKSHGKFKGQNFKHDFKSGTDAMVMGNPDGSLTIRSKKGKPLWKKFNY